MLTRTWQYSRIIRWGSAWSVVDWARKSFSMLGNDVIPLFKVSIGTAFQKMRSHQAVLSKQKINWNRWKKHSIALEWTDLFFAFFIQRWCLCRLNSNNNSRLILILSGWWRQTRDQNIKRNHAFQSHFLDRILSSQFAMYIQIVYNDNNEKVFHFLVIVLTLDALISFTRGRNMLSNFSLPSLYVFQNC